MWSCIVFSLLGPGQQRSECSRRNWTIGNRKLIHWQLNLLYRPSLQMVFSRPVALFDIYAVIAALDEVVNVRKDKKGDRATRFEIALRQCRPLINNPAL